MEKIPQFTPEPNPEAEKLSALRALIEGEPQAFFILVGAMKYNEIKKRYESGAFSDEDENSKLTTGVGLATGGKDRVIAAAEIHKAYPGAKIIAMSKTRDAAKPTYAAVTRDELLQKGVASESIVLEEESVNTITEYKEAAKIWQDKKWDSIAFISSDWHLPRCQELFNHIENFADTEAETELLREFADAVRSGALQVQFVGTTSVLSVRSSHYKPLFKALENYPALNARIEQEQKALRQIEEGNYGGRTLTKRMYDKTNEDPNDGA